MLGLKQLLPGLFGTKTTYTQKIGLKKPELNKTLADIAYKKERPQEIQDVGLDLIYQPNLSTDRIAVYKDDNKKHIKVAFRGTVPTSLRDLLSDVKIATGIGRESDPYMVEAETLIKRLKSAYPNYRITTTGHSLGGYISREISKKEGLEGVGFNPGAGLPELFGKRDPKQFRTERNLGDIVSALAKPSNTGGEQYVGILGQHGLSTF